MTGFRSRSGSSSAVAEDDSYQNVRDANLLGPLVGRRVVDITQQDADEFAETGSFVCLHFDNGWTVTFPIGDDGFEIDAPDASVS